jgi:hypothetical protein
MLRVHARLHHDPVVPTLAPAGGKRIRGTDSGKEEADGRRAMTGHMTIEWIKIAPQEMDRVQARITKRTQLKLVRVPELEGEPSVIDLGEILTVDSDG